jgi:hypothetical protein
VDDARIAPIVGPAEAEEFFATGHNAFTGETTSPITVDVPAVGATPAADLPSLSSDADPIHVSTLANNDKRNLAQIRALSELVFAARDLAEGNVLAPALNGGKAFCNECQGSQRTPSEAIDHLTWCRTGRVRRALGDLEDSCGIVLSLSGLNGGAR